MLFFTSNKFILINLQNKFSSPHGSVWHSLTSLFSFCHWILLHFWCFCIKSVLPRHSLSHWPSSQELLETQLWCPLSQGFLSPSPIPWLDVCLYLLPKKDEFAPARSLHPALDLILRDHMERLSLQTGFRLDESWKRNTNIPRIVDWANFFRQRPQKWTWYGRFSIILYSWIIRF